jgi:hypothetical protein
MSSEEEKQIIEVVRKLCSKLSEGSVSMTAAAQTIGAVSEAGGASDELAVTPGLPAFERAQVVAESGRSDSPSHVTLKLRAPSLLSLKALEDSFGPSRSVPRTSHSTGPRVGILIETPGRPYTCTLVAVLTPDGAMVTELTVRRDIRLKD